MLDQIHDGRAAAFPTPAWARIAGPTSNATTPGRCPAPPAGSLDIEHTLAQNGARRLWELLQTDDLVRRSAPSRATRPSSR